MYLKTITTLAILFPVIAQADLVNTLYATSLCSTALNAHRTRILGGTKSDQIDCLTLKNYFATIDNQPSHRSFERARAFVNAQRIIGVLDKQFRHNQDVSRLQEQLNKAFQRNFKELKELTKASVLERFDKPLRRGEQIFFFGAQNMNEGLYILEGRKKGKQAKFVDKVIKPRPSYERFPDKPLSLRVGNDYFSLDEIQSADFRDGIYGFYIKSRRIVVPAPNNYSQNLLYKMGRELADMLRIPVEQQRQYRAQGNNPYAPVPLIDEPSTTDEIHRSRINHSTSRVNSCHDLEDLSKEKYQTKIHGLSLRKEPGTNSNVLTSLDKGTIVYQLLSPETNELCESSFWICVCVDTTKDGVKTGWVSGKPKYLEPLDY